MRTACGKACGAGGKDLCQIKSGHRLVRLHRIFTMNTPFPTLAPEEAAAMVQDNQTAGFGGFTAAGACKVIPLAIAAKAKAEHAAGRPFKLGVITGASTGKSLDGALAEAEAIAWRTPYQADPVPRKSINAGKTSSLISTSLRFSRRRAGACF